VELDDGHGEGDDHMWWWSSAQLGKEEKRKIKTKKIKANISNRFLFWWSRHYRECDHV
jgi:hypothetical protein